MIKFQYIQVAVSDETSVAGRAGLVDQAQFARAAVAIDQACRALCDSSSNQQQVTYAYTYDRCSYGSWYTGSD